MNESFSFCQSENVGKMETDFPWFRRIYDI